MYEARLAAIQQRLRATVDARPFVFRDTSAEDQQRYLARLTTFRGHSPAEIDGIERELGLPLPIAMRELLLTFGAASGGLFDGEDLPAPGEWNELREQAQSLIRETDADLTLPGDAIVFLFHQGYAFHFVHAGGDDPRVWTYVEGDRQFTETDTTYLGIAEDLVDAIESNCRGQHELGGYFVTVHRDGSVALTYPAQKNRPFLQKPRKWWQFWK